MYLRPYSFMVNLDTCAVVKRLITSDRKTPGVMITAARANTGYVYLGTSNVTSADYFADLAAGDSFTITGETFGWANAEVNMRDISLVSSSTGTVSVMWLGRVDEDDV